MSIGNCEAPQYHCNYRRTVGHHLYWPRNRYQTELESAFRNLPMNVVQICECAEKMIHQFTSPPDKPSLQEMIIALTVEFTPED